jgi:hypothetical protein
MTPLRLTGTSAHAVDLRRVEEMMNAHVMGPPRGASEGDLRARIAWYEAVALERKALRCFARAPRSPLTRALVDHGQACLDRLGAIR